MFCQWKDTTSMDLTEMGHEDVNFLLLAEDLTWQ
jgi:hypothetical protein